MTKRSNKTNRLKTVAAALILTLAAGLIAGGFLAVRQAEKAEAARYGNSTEVFNRSFFAYTSWNDYGDLSISVGVKIENNGLFITEDIFSVFPAYSPGYGEIFYIYKLRIYSLTQSQNIGDISFTASSSPSWSAGSGSSAQLGNTGYIRHSSFIGQQTLNDIGLVSGNKYRISFVPGIFGEDYSFPPFIHDVFSVIVDEFTYQTTAALPAEPEKNGYAFAGWYYNEAFTTPYAGEVLYADTQLYAKFNIIDYSITYNLDGGTNAAGNPVTYTVEDAAIELQDPAREGWAFDGWVEADGIPAGSTGDKTFTAKWTRVFVTVRFMVDGEEYAILTVAYGTSLQMAAEYAGLSLFNNYNLADGTKLSGTSRLVDDTVLSVVEASAFEKVLIFIREYSFIFIMLFVGLLVLLVVIGFVVKLVRR